MFKFLKEKLGNALNKFTKKAEEEEITKEEIEEQPKKEVKQEKVKEKSKEKVKEEKKEESTKKEPKEKKGFFEKVKEKVTTTKISEEKFEDMFWDLEVALMENNVSVEVIEKIKESLKMDLVDVPIKRGNVSEIVEKSLRESLDEILTFESFDLVKKVKEKKEKPFVIVFFGPNGVGKTTSIAKVAYLLKKNGLKCVLAAGDSFRAASQEQLKDWADKIGVDLVGSQYGSDPASIGYDSIMRAKKHKLDAVLMDTAGRQHSNKNLMEELKKITRVMKPDLKIFVGETLAGNDASIQIKEYDNSIGIDGIILTKADSDEKGGTIISVSFVTGKPIIYMGTGQNAGDLKTFNKQEVIEYVLK